MPEVPEVPGLAEWELQQREVLQAERRLRAGQDTADQPDTTTTTTTEMSTEKTDLSTLPPELKSILKMSFQKLLSKLQQKTTDEIEQSSRSNPTSRPSVLPTERNENKKLVSGNYLDHLLSSYRNSQREIPRSFSQFLTTPDTIPLANELLEEDYNFDLGGNTFPSQGLSEIGFAIKESRQLDTSLRRFLKRLETL